MQSVELYKLGDDKDTLATKWSYVFSSPYLVFRVRRSNYEGSKPFPLKRFDIVKLDYYVSWKKPNEHSIEYGVVTSMLEQYKYNWRIDMDVRVKKFDNVLDAIEYSEKKRAKYGNG